MRSHRTELLLLFARMAVFTRKELEKAAVGPIYKTTNGLWNVVDELEADNMLVVGRIGKTSTFPGIKNDVRLTLNGLDWLANNAMDTKAEYVPSNPNKPAVVMVKEQTPANPCRQRMRTCYARGCYLRDRCDAYREG